MENDDQNTKTETEAQPPYGGGFAAPICSLPWYLLGCACHHCGEEISGRPAEESGLIVSGLEAMEYRHAHTKNRKCTGVDWITERDTDAEPYSPWGQRAKWDALYSANTAISGQRP